MSTYEEILREIAITKVTRGEVTITPGVEDQIAAKRNTIAGLRDGSIQRDSPRTAYQAQLAQLQADIDDLIVQNNGIAADNELARQAVETQYQSDIQAEMLELDTIAEAEARAFNEDYVTRLAAIEQALLELGEAML